MSTWQLWALGFAVSVWASSAQAQISRGAFRLSLDTDVLSVAGVEVDPEGAGGEQDTTVFGIGPNAQGSSRISGEPTPFGLGLGWGLSPKLVLGVRVGFGLDVVASDGAVDNTRLLGLSLMPGLTFVPVGHKAKLYLSAAPLFQVDRSKTGPNDARTLLGGFGLGIGTLIFVAHSLSVDLGFHFEGRFGNREDDNDNEWHIRDLRGVIRLGLSLWM